MKKLFSVLLLLITVVLASCSQKNDKEVVVTSFYVINDITEKCLNGINDIEIVNLANSEPHEFELTTSDVNNLYKAKLIILNGLELEEFEEDFTSELKAKTKYATNGIEGIKTKKMIDPHAWASLDNAKIYTSNISSYLIDAFPKYKEKISQNKDNLISKIDALKTKLESKFSVISNKKIIVSHEAFNYFGLQFGIEVKSILSIHQEEPDSKTLTDIINYAKENNVKTVFTEYSESDSLAKSVVNELDNAKILALYTLECAPDNLDYLGAVEYNANKIIEALNGK